MLILPPSHTGTAETDDNDVEGGSSLPTTATSPKSLLEQFIAAEQIKIKTATPVAPVGSRKPYGCQYCSHRTARLRDLLDHERVHTGEKPYSCPFCPFKSAFASSARVHERRHLSPAFSK